VRGSAARSVAPGAGCDYSLPEYDGSELECDRSELNCDRLLKDRDLNFREEIVRTRGAIHESSNALPRCPIRHGELNGTREGGSSGRPDECGEMSRLIPRASRGGHEAVDGELAPALKQIEDPAAFMVLEDVVFRATLA
jgi:hypothetical protein